MNALSAIGERLRARIGLDPATLGAGALAHAVQARSRARGLAGAVAYLAALDTDAAEWDALVETITVPETWFFRDRAPFALLAARAAGLWAARGADDPVRVLSLPCASGEEAWSIAIALVAAGLAPAAIRIDAVDLSERALAVARAGVYAARALRGHRIDPAWSRYLEPRPDGRLRVAEALRGSVRFARGNLVGLGRAFACGSFDCISSRNLLIYCDDVTRAAAIADFGALLKADGLLVLGHAETLPAGTPGFVREGPPGAFAWRKDTLSREREGKGEGDRIDQARSHRPHPSPLPRGRGRVSRRPSMDDLGAARRLADRGKLEDAAALVETRLAKAPADAAAHALLGIVRAAQSRDDEAVEHLRRALYLEPAHEEALVHLALILERRGDTAGADRLRTRARRAGVS